MNRIYPLKFKPIPQYRIWGGIGMNAFVPEDLRMDKLGEIWSISGVEGNISVVENGELKLKNLKELISEFGEKLMGKELYLKFGNEFPLLIKFIDAAQSLSVQVHPNDEQAKRLHNSFGKSEMWYIIDAENDAELVVGFKDGASKEKYQQSINSGTLDNILNKVPISKGEAVYIPAGRVHAIGAGIVLAEIQQTSDITYRIYDYNRIDKDGKKRELHTDQAMEVIDFGPIQEYKTSYEQTENQFNKLVDSPFFKTRIFNGDKEIKVQNNDKMRIYICTSGNLTFRTVDSEVSLKAFESLLIPAGISEFEIQFNSKSTLIEVTV